MAERAKLVTFGRAVRQARQERGLSVEALAAAVGIADGELEAIEAGALGPRPTGRPAAPYFGALASGAGAVLGLVASIRSKRCAISMKLTSRPAASWSITRKDRLISPRSHEPT
jgi:transcriptional regulator with XRE-family HTH domain